MCEPTTILTAAGMSAQAASTAALAIQGASAAAAVAGTIDQANKQNAAVAQNAASARDAYFLKTSQNNLRLRQEQTQASQQKMDASLKTMRAQSSANAAAAAAGVKGVDVARLIQDFERSEGILNDRINQGLEGRSAQAGMEQLSYQSEAFSRINSMQPVGFAETLFKIAEPIAGFGADYMDTVSKYAELEE